MADMNQLIRQIQIPDIPELDEPEDKYGSFPVNQPQGEEFQRKEQLALQKIEDIRKYPGFKQLKPHEQDWLVEQAINELEEAKQQEKSFEGPVQDPGRPAKDFLIESGKQLALSAPLPLAGASVGLNIAKQLGRGKFAQEIGGAIGAGLGEYGNQLSGITNPSQLDIGLAVGVPLVGALAGAGIRGVKKGRAMSHPASKTVLGERQYQEALAEVPYPKESAQSLFSKLQQDPDYKRTWQEWQGTGKKVPFTQMTDDVNTPIQPWELEEREVFEQVTRKPVAMGSTQGLANDVMQEASRLADSGELGQDVLAQVRKAFTLPQEMTPEGIDFQLKNISALQGNESIHPILKKKLSQLKDSLWEDIMNSPLKLKEGMAEAYHVHKQEIIGDKLRSMLRGASGYPAGEPVLNNPGSVVKAMDEFTDFSKYPENEHYFLPDRQTGEPVITEEDWKNLRSFIAGLARESYKYGGNVGTLGEQGAMAGLGFAGGSGVMEAIANEPSMLQKGVAGATGVIAGLTGMKMRAVRQKEKMMARTPSGQMLRDRLIKQLREGSPGMSAGKKVGLGVGASLPITNYEE